MSKTDKILRRRAKSPQPGRNVIVRMISLLSMLAVLVTASSVTSGDFGPSLGGPVAPGTAPVGSTEPTAVQWSLIWTGFYNGIVDGSLGKRSRDAIAAWQASRGVAGTGILDGAQAYLLHRQAGSIASGFEWTAFENAEVGYRIAYPARYLRLSEPLPFGGRRFKSSDGTFTLAVEVDGDPGEAGFRGLYDRVAASGPQREVGYKVFKGVWFVLHGKSNGVSFYTRIERRPGGIVGFTFMWPTERMGEVSPAVTAMVSAFSVGPRVMLDRETATTPSARLPEQVSPNPTPHTRRSPAVPAQAGPRTERLDAAGVFRATKDAVWIVLAAKSYGGRVDRSTIVLGSAVAVTDHLLLTNCHTLRDRDAVVVVKDAKAAAPVRAEPVKVETEADRCVLFVDQRLPVTVPVRDFRDIEVGERVYTIGAPSGLDLTLGDGLVSAKRTMKGIDYVQTTAPISPGSSGGGLFDDRGNLIGITTFLLRDAQNLNFAIAADSFPWKAGERRRAIYESLQASGFRLLRSSDGHAGHQVPQQG